MSDLKALPRGVWVLVGGQFINRFGAFVVPFLPLFLRQRGLDMSHISMVLGAVGLGQLFAPFGGGYMADAFGRRNTIVTALVCGATMMVGLYLCPTVPLMMVVGLLWGFTANLFGSAANALLSDLVTPTQRVTAFAMLRLAINAGFSAGPAIAGWLFAISPLLIFTGDAATTLIFGLLALTLLPHGLRTVTGRVTSPSVFVKSWTEAGRDAWHNRAFRQVYVCSLLMAVGFFQVMHILSLHAEAQGLSMQRYGVVMGLNGFLILLFELPLTYLVRRYPVKKALAVGFALVGLGTASFAFVHSQAGFLAAMTVFTVGEMIALPVASAYVSELAPVALRGRYFGVQGTTWGLSSLLGSMGPLIYGHLGAAWWVIAGALGVVGGVGMVGRVKSEN